MSRSRPEHIFHEARQKLIGVERDAYLQGACGTDLGLRSKVEALLRADAEAGTFLASGGPSWAESDSATCDEQIGAIIGRYKLLQKIGEGGFGVVYLAEQKQPVKRRVALKVIKPGMDTRQVIARFEAERQALAMMDHQHIAKVLDAGATEGGRPYFVMELVKGIPITDYCDQNKLNVAERLDLFAQVCHAVQHAHQKGIIHRDIKPSNVLVTLHDGVPVPKVIDFGIAKATSAELTEKTLFTEHGQMIGTPVYMSPEQAELSGLDIDTRSDIYSLGVLLYELLTGTTPFTLEDLRAAGYGEIRRLICEQEPPKPSTRLSTLGTLSQVASHRSVEPRKLGLMIRGDLDWIIMRALEKDRTRRYETANEFAADLGRFLRDEPVHASPPSASYRMRKFVRRNRKRVIAGTVMAVVLLVAAGVSIHFGLRADQQRRVAEDAQAGAEEAQAGEVRQRQVAERNADQAEKAAEQLATTNGTLQMEIERAERLSYSAFLHAAQAALGAGNFQDARRLHSQCPKSLRNWEWYHLRLSLDQSLQTLEGHGGGVRSVAWSPDGSRIVSGADDNTLYIWNVASGERLQTLEGHEFAVNSVAWSPDGTRIVSGSSDITLRIWDAASGESMQTLEGHGGGVRSVAWSPDGSRIVSGSDDNTLCIWNVASGARLQTLEGHEFAVNSVAWSPDGTRIVSGSSDITLRIWDAASGESMQTLEGHVHSVDSVAWSPDGTRIVSGSSYYGTLRIWDAASGESLQTLEGQEFWVFSVAWSPDGTRIVSGSYDDTLRIWDAASGENLQTLEGHEGLVVSVAWSPDGTRIVSGSSDGTLRIWDATSGGSMQTLEGHGDEVNSVAWSPDGMRIVSGSVYDNTLRIWDTASGESLQTLEGQSWVFSVAWSPDGTRIVSGSNGSTLRVWDATSGESLQTLEGHESRGAIVAWSPDGRRIVSGSSDVTLRIWDAVSGESLQALEGHEKVVASVAWSPDGKRIVSGSGYGALRIWDAASGESLQSLEGHERSVASVAWSPDGTRIVSGSHDGTLRTWDATSGESLQTLEGHEFAVNSVAWSPDGARIVSGSFDKTLRIWDAVSGENLRTLEGHGDGVYSVAWSPDGTRIVSASADKTLRIWESRLEDALPVWRAADQRRRVRPLVNSLFDEHVFLEPVLSALRADRTLSTDLRETALRLASSSSPSANQLHRRARDLVRPDREDKQTDVALGLRLARASAELRPEDESIRYTLAWALFANGFYDEALVESAKALERASEGQKDYYQETLDRLRAEIASLREPGIDDAEAEED